MTIETLSTQYPKFFASLKEEVSALRYLLVIDFNYNDIDSDEFDAIDPEDYNYLIHITELLQESIGETRVIEFVKKLQGHSTIEEFYLSDADLYGIQTSLDEEGIAHMILTLIEELM